MAIKGEPEKMKDDKIVCRCGSEMKEAGYAFNAINYPRFTCEACGNEAVAYLPFSIEKIREALWRLSP